MLAAKSQRTSLQFKNKLCDYCIEKPVEFPSYISNHLTPFYQNEINAYIEYMKCPLTVELMDILGIALCPVAIDHHHLKLLPMSSNRAPYRTKIVYSKLIGLHIQIYPIITYASKILHVHVHVTMAKQEK